MTKNVGRPALRSAASAILLLVSGVAVAEPPASQLGGVNHKGAPSAPAKVGERTAVGAKLRASGGADGAARQYDAALRLVASGEYRTARAACLRLQRSHPDSELGLICEAKAHLAHRRASRALPLIEALRSRQAGSVEVQLLEAEAKRMMSELAAAARGYEMVLDASAATPDQRARAHLGRAKLAGLVSDNARELEELRAAKREDPENAETLYLLGVATPGAAGLPELQRAVELVEANLDARLALAERLIGLGQYAEARSVLQSKQLERAGVNYAAVRDSLRGQALLGLGEVDAAEKALTAALQAAPSDAAATAGLAAIRDRQGRPEEAVELYRRAYGLRPVDPTPLLSAGRVALASEQRNLALGIAQLASRQHADDPRAQALKGDVLKARGDRPGARAAYEAALRRGDFEGREQVEQDLAALGGQ